MISVGAISIHNNITLNLITIIHFFPNCLQIIHQRLNTELVVDNLEVTGSSQE